MKERLIERADQSNHWLSELVQELTGSSDTELLDELDLSPDGTTASESQFDMLSEALTELESLHPELFENLPLPENVAQELTDDEMVESMEQWEKEMMTLSIPTIICWRMK